MKIVCTQENLKIGLALVNRIVSSSTTLPILSNILLKTVNGQLALVATNLETAITTLLRCKIEIPGEICLPAKTLTEIINSLPAENLSLEKIEGLLRITCPGFELDLKYMPADDFPLIPEIAEPVKIELDTPKFIKALNSVVFAASTNENQLEIAGVLFKFNGKSLIMAATDRYRLAEITTHLTNAGDIREVILPLRAVAETIRVFGNFSEKINMLIASGQVVFENSTTRIISRIVDGQYPEYTQIIPETFLTSIKVKKQALLSALKAAGVFATGANSVILEYKIENNSLALSATSDALGKSRIVLEALISGEDGSVIFNYQYLSQGVSAIPSDEVELKLVNPFSPVMCVPVGDTSFRYLVMPIKN